MKISRIFIVAFALVSSSCAANLDHEQSLQKGMSAYERGDFTEALKEWQTLAEEGNAAAQANLGSLYISGKGVPADDLEAAKWFTKAAFQSSVIAQLSLGYMHEKGLSGAHQITQKQLDGSGRPQSKEMLVLNISSESSTNLDLGSNRILDKLCNGMNSPLLKVMQKLKCNWAVFTLTENRSRKTMKLSP
jgi:hypothetical protein